jgi:membrane protease YdiL (CAAX protease family)
MDKKSKKPDSSKAPADVKKPVATAPKAATGRKFFDAIKPFGWAIWIAVSFGGATLLTYGLVDVLKPLLRMISNETLLETILSAVIYLFLLTIAIGIPYKVLKMNRAGLGKLLGLERAPKLKDFGRAILMFLVYYGLLFAVMMVLGVIINAFGGDFNSIMSQSQDTGFSKTGNSAVELVLIFITLVVIPPLCEETVMRGFLFGKLSAKWKWLPAAIVTSLLFGLLHGQLNVGIDTFVLSMVLCYSRKNYGNIWTGIFVHMLKNGLAFALLFTPLSMMMV